MEANTKQQQLTFDKGITNVPSDAICSDNAISESVGMVYENGEHRIIQKPADFITSSVDESDKQISIRLLYVHKLNDEERYIVAASTKISGNIFYILAWGTKEGAVFKKKGDLLTEGGMLRYTESTQITSIGKTLIISDNDGIKYYLWTQDKDNNNIYEYLGSSFPKPEVEFTLYGRNEKYGGFNHEEQIDCSGMLYYENGKYGVTLGKEEDWNNAVIGLYSKLRKKLWQDKKFHGSFCIRAALELYDGTYFHISNPVFMLNHFSTYGTARISGENPKLLTMTVYGQGLRYKFSQDYTKWSDIIKNVVLFVTKEANIFDTTVDAKCLVPSSLAIGGGSTNVPISYFMSGNKIYHDSTYLDSSDVEHGAGHLYLVMESIPDSDLDNTIKDGVYYKLCEVGLTGDGEFHNASDHFDTHKLENITTQEQLGEDDYYSHCPIRSGLLYAYNSRLNIANVSRGFFDGFDNFMPFDNDDYHEYESLVTIQTDGEWVVVSHKYRTKQKQGIYFYYPDPRAKHVVILKDGNQILNTDLIGHPTLNGAYYFGGVSTSMDEPTSASGEIPEATENSYETLPNYIITSEVNNPFTFKAAGYYKVGTGKILGMSTITQALSEGQFGQFPMLVFSDSGVWALSVAGTGYFNDIHPMSREVCNNPKSITQTDGAVFFTSEKGLMVVAGSDVRCMSEQMSGREDEFDGIVKVGNFADYLRNCFIAYDYRDSLLWIFNGTEYCYIYSIKTGTFSKNILPDAVIENVVNNYPDYLIQATDGKVYSLTERTNINDDETDYEAFIITRPMKLENSIALKSIRQIRHITDMQGTLKLRIFASNNLRHWAELHSLRGTPWKYFRFRYDFQNLKATDRFSGSIVVTQDRRTDKLR